ncbi:MAG: hypothetical protein AAGL24_21315 [Pseudomonadota bacterium]
MIFVKAAIVSVAGMLVGMGIAALQPGVEDKPLRMVVERGDGYVELYFSTPASTLADLFGLPPQSLAGPDGTVNFDRLRLGTANIGDQLFEDVVSRAGGAQIDFEAMSLMVHPIDDTLPLNDPVDGVLAISVCNAEDPEAPLGLSGLQAYSGFFASTANHAETISLTLPNASGRTWTVLVRDHVNGDFQSEYVVSISKDGRLSLPANRMPAAS